MIGVQNRQFGWLEGSSLSGVQSRPFQSVRCAGGSSVMPSHQMSPSSVSATLVKTELPLVDGAHGVRVGVPAGARGDAEQAVLGVDARRAGRPRRTASRRCRRRASRPSSPGWSARAWPGWSCRRRSGTPRRCSSVLLLGRGQLEDQHVLGEPALVAGHHRGDAQRVALLAEQRVAAVARAVGPDHPLLGEVDDVLGVVARPRHVGLARRPAGRRPSAAPGTNGAVVAHRPRARALPIRVMIRIEATTYSESVISTPNIGLSALERAHAERDDVHRPAAHAARGTARS